VKNESKDDLMGYFTLCNVQISLMNLKLIAKLEVGLLRSTFGVFFSIFFLIPLKLKVKVFIIPHPKKKSRKFQNSFFFS
jgi:hypothetical protein